VFVAAFTPQNKHGAEQQEIGNEEADKVPAKSFAL